MTKLIDITGKALSGEWGTDDLDGSGTPVLRTTNFTNIGKVNYDNVVTRNIQKKNISEKLLKKGDIIIEKSGGTDKNPVGRVIYFEGEENKYLFNNFTGLLRIKDKNEWYPKFVFYSMLANYNRGGTRRFENKTTGLHNLKLDDYVKRLEIQKLPYIDQTHICKLLDCVRFQLDNMEKELELLDELVKARFVEMFGDVGMGLFNYQTCKLGDVAKVGSSHRVFTTESGIPFYRGTEIGELANGKKPINPYYISEEHYKRLAKDETKPLIGDLLMPSICNKGQVWMVDSEEPFYYKDGRVLCISPNKEVFNSRFLQYFMREKTLVEYPKIGSGSTFAEFKIFLLKDMDVLVPPLELQNQFASFVEEIDKSQFVLHQ